MSWSIPWVSKQAWRRAHFASTARHARVSIMAKKKTKSTARTRVERDSMGEMKVPASVLFGASTQRAVLNFPISGRAIAPKVIHAFGLLKRACAEANRELDKLDQRRTRIIVAACNEII